ncbi:MAG TPA: hypothetical protein VJ205_00350, partial [Gammaproteobacteria bacterium]|nr:hypothetical protein [Gammaproteobacteria bacterium]
MQRKIIIALAFVILVVSLISGLIYVQQQSSPSKPTTLQNIIIQQDGTVYPSNASIQRNENL